MKRILNLTIPIALTACTMDPIETHALADRAISDARQQPKSVHLAYLHCYALQDVDKDICHRAIRERIEGIKSVSSWEYIRPFDYEAERLGFVAFLRDRGKNCKSVNEGPRYSKEADVYIVNCTDGNKYSMRFDSNTGNWSIVK